MQQKGQVRKVKPFDRLETNLDLARSLRFRAPYIDPRNLVQIELLRQRRQEAESMELDHTLAATINGIASGLRNTVEK